jgi:hypothetical protein
MSESNHIFIKFNDCYELMAAELIIKHFLECIDEEGGEYYNLTPNGQKFFDDKGEWDKRIKDEVHKVHFPLTLQLNSLGIEDWDHCKNAKKSSTFRFAPKRIVDFLKENASGKIKVGDYEVEEEDGGIQVGCTFVSDEQIEKIYKMRFGNE